MHRSYGTPTLPNKWQRLSACKINSLDSSQSSASKQNQLMTSTTRTSQKKWNYVDSLKLRREIADIKLTIKSFNDVIDSWTFLQNFSQTLKGPTRSTDTFLLKTCRTDPGKFSVINRLMTTFNKYCSNDDWLRHLPSDYHQQKFPNKNFRPEFSPDVKRLMREKSDANIAPNNHF